MENPLVVEVHTSKITRAVVWDQAEECLLEPASLHCSSKLYYSSELEIGELLLFVCVCLCDLCPYISYGGILRACYMCMGLRERDM